MKINSPTMPNKIGSGKTFLVVSGHDLRSKRKANVHYITEELAKRGTTAFFSLGFSWLSNLKGTDPRLGLYIAANEPELFASVETYLWKTILHPGRIDFSPLQSVVRQWFRLYGKALPAWFEDKVRTADVILIESGIGVATLDKVFLLKRPDAEVIYIASDDLHTIRTDKYLVDLLDRHAVNFTGIRVPSSRLASLFPPGSPVHFVPHGVELPSKDEIGPSPYSCQRNAVSVGSMLFDCKFFEIAVDAFPDIEFHVIGCGVPRKMLPARVIYHEEMAHSETLPYIAHASFGVAPYFSKTAPYYLCDTSMKLMQYQYYGLPAVCPNFAAGHQRMRFGYEPGERGSIVCAIRDALSAGFQEPVATLTWSEVVDRILAPGWFPDTQISGLNWFR